jgi:hypothetical protein
LEKDCISEVDFLEIILAIAAVAVFVSPISLIKVFEKRITVEL